MTFRHYKLVMFLAVLSLAIVQSGCNKQTEEDQFSRTASKRKEKAQAKNQEKAATKEKSAANDKEKPKSPTGAVVVVEEAKPRGEGILAHDPLQPDVAAMPEVVMSRAHEATCLVKVGDAMPPARLADLRGQQQELSKLMGDRLTVVVFWKSNSRRSLAELSDLSRQVASSLAPQGVRVVAICERDAANAARTATDKLGLPFPVLVDADGKYFAQVATAKLPRTYVLDASGKVIWFDIDYSRSMRRDFREALRSVLAAQ